MLSARLLRSALLLCFPGLATAATIVVTDESGEYHGSGCGTSGVGQCTLVDAIAFSNTSSGPDTIRFNIPGGGTRTIVPSGPLPPLSDNAGVVIDGFTQPGASPNTLSAGSNAVWRVRLSGGSVIAQSAGILAQSNNNVVRGLILQAWQSGVEIAGSSGNQVVGNLVGLDVPGELANGYGVLLRSGANGNRIGGTAAADRNVVSRNSVGIQVMDLGTSNNVVQGNIVGLSPSGRTVLRNFRGITLFQGASSNQIGGSAEGAGNLISGNETNGIEVILSSGNRIEGNWIGTTEDGMTAAANLQAGISVLGGDGNVLGGTAPGAGNLIAGNGVGVVLSGSDTRNNRVEGNLIGTNAEASAALPNGNGVDISLSARENVVGGVAAGARNIISGNTGSAVSIAGSATQNSILGNSIGTDAMGVARLGNGGDIFTAYPAIQIAGASRNRVEANVIAYNGNPWVGGSGILILSGFQVDDAMENAIRGNSIHGNHGLGIDLYEPAFPYRVTPNDAGDGDSGPNAFQNYPVIQGVSFSVGSVTITGSLNSTASTTLTLEFFGNHRCDGSGHGEGEIFLGSSPITTDAAGTATFHVVFPVSTPTARRVSATATDAAGNSSEFSKCFPEPSNFYAVSPCRVADTRDPPGPSGGPALAAGAERVFPIMGRCGIPPSAQAVSFNFTAVSPTTSGFLTIYPVGERKPLASSLNYRQSQIRANNAIIPLGTDGLIAVGCSQSSGTTHLVIDVNGYFE